MLLIDAYNVLHLPQTPEPLEAGGVAELCRLLGASRYAGQRAAAICDGTPPPVDRGPGTARAATRTQVCGVEVCYVGGGRSADDEIERRLKAHGGRGVTVVSSDRRLRRAAGRARARSVASATFLGHLLRDAGRRPAPLPDFVSDVPLDPYSVAGWMREFGLEPGDPTARRINRESRPAAERARPSPPPVESPPPEAPDLGPEPPIDIGRVLDDPLLREAVREWGERLPPEELDMGRWLGSRGRRRGGGQR